MSVKPDSVRERIMQTAAAMPAAPRIFAELGWRLRDAQCPLEEVAALVKRDTALAARVLRVSNSAVHQGAQATASVEEAVLRIGYRELFQLVGILAGEQLADSALRHYGIQPAELRTHLLKTALVCEQLAQDCEVDTRAAYTAGLMRAIGLFVCDRLADRYDGVKDWHPAHDPDYLSWEARVFGLGNCEVAAIVLAEWRFPEDVVHGIREHYLNGGGEETPSRLAYLLNVACTLVADNGQGLLGEARHWGVTSAKLAMLGLTQRKIAAANERAEKLFAGSQALTKEPAGTDAAAARASATGTPSRVPPAAGSP